MANLKEVRLRIASVQSTQQITKAMKMVSAAKLKRATNAILQLRPYATKLRDILGNLSATLEQTSSPFTHEREAKKVLVVVIASNRGLAGAFNMNVIKATNQLLSGKYKSQFDAGNVSLICVGKKVQDFFEKRNFKVLGNHNELFSDLSFENVTLITDEIMQRYAKGEFDVVEVVYNRFKNAAVQFTTVEQLLPLIKDEKEDHTAKALEVEYILEPSKAEIVEELIPKTIRIQLYKAVLDSHASEHGARMTSMDKATENAGELLKNLKLSYNQARQAAITTELTEIVSGAAALNG